MSSAVPKYTNRSNNTNATTVQQYIDIYAGSEILMEYRYAYILTTIFVTFTFGFGIPILFPICAFSLLVEYVCTISQLYWQYKQPHNFDEKLSNEVLSQLTWAPVFYLSFGYWMASSK